eukprot:10200779-Heterocapsa_arctica.AAC.1
MEPVARFIESSRNTANQKGIAKCLACDRIWTRQRAFEAGYEVPDTNCALCLTCPDTVQHRLYECQAPQARIAREASVPTEFVQQADIELAK